MREREGKMKQLKISLPENVMDDVCRMAKRLGLTPSQFIRVKMCEMVCGFKLDVPEKKYVVPLADWREVEAYVRVKGVGSVEYFLSEAAKSVMRRNALTSAQKTEVEALLEK
jgi:hypothetical protein